MNKTIATSIIALSQDLPFEFVAHENAVRYQKWIIDAIQPYLGARILELGAGIGHLSRWLTSADCVILTEPNPELLSFLKIRMNQSQFPHIKIHPLDITQSDLSEFQNEQIDTIVSFNVLEHIEDDKNVLQNCVNLLSHNKSPRKKRIITFVPAHQWAYGAMDKKAGHYRRYNREMFKKLHQQVAPRARLILKPFNFVGLWGWITNGRIMQRSNAGVGVISFFDKICPFLRLVDEVVIHRFNIPIGQSLIAIVEW